MKAKYFIPKPKPIGETAINGLAVYLTETGQRLFWSAPFPLPEIGDRITITMNSIGPAVVRGYFSEAGYLGVMTFPTKPPKWLLDQQKLDQADHSAPEWVKDGVGCEFGAEIALTKLTPSEQAAFQRGGGAITEDVAARLLGTDVAEIKLMLKQTRKRPVKQA